MHFLTIGLKFCELYYQLTLALKTPPLRSRYSAPTRLPFLQAPGIIKCKRYLHTWFHLRMFCKMAEFSSITALVIACSTSSVVSVSVLIFLLLWKLVRIPMTNFSFSICTEVVRAILIHASTWRLKIVKSWIRLLDFSFQIESKALKSKCSLVTFLQHSWSF